MAVITKKIGNKSYAYLSVREGKKVVHRYIGPAGSPDTQKKMAIYAETGSIPQKFRPLFWDAKLEDISIKMNAPYIIERILDLGDMDALKWLQLVYPVRKIVDVIATNKALSEKSRNFWSLWFDQNP